MKTVRYLDICTIDGQVLFSFCLTEREVRETYAAAEQPASPPSKPTITAQQRSPVEKKNGTPDGEPMTQAQQRKLFRLLAAKEIEGERAHDELKRLFQVVSLSDIRKAEASAMIDRLIQETKGGNGHGPSL